MHVFHIKGFSGLVMLVLAVIAAIALLVVLPTSFMMVLWNAVVFEGAKGPEINMLQGFLLWGFTAVMLKLIFKPQFKLQFQQMPPAGKVVSKQTAKTSEPEEQAIPLEEATPLDNQN